MLVKIILKYWNFFFFNQKAIEVTIEVGHKAFIKEKPDSKGHTHDWNVYVRASDNQSIEKLVNKVQFTLHETFPKPFRSKFLALSLVFDYFPSIF